MFDAQQKQTKQSLQVKFAQSLAIFKDIVTLPEYKAIQDMSLGMLKSQSVINLKIACSLNEKVTPKKVCERFTRHLNKKDLGPKLQSLIITKQCRNIDPDTAIIVDESDIVKSRAKRMEGLKQVRDGSTGRVDQLGYDLLNIIAYQSRGESYEIKPISSDLIAQDIDPDGIFNITQDRLVQIILSCNNRGVLVFDRGYDKRTMFRFIKDNACNYVLRSKGKRGLIVDGQEKAFNDVAKSIKLTHSYNLEKSGQYLKCGIKRVAIRLNPHPVKHPETVETWLIVARYSKDEKDREGFFYLFCDFPGQLDLSLEQLILKALKMYRMRWKIEEVHRHIKQSYGWEKIQLTSYTRLQNMTQILLLTMCYLYSLKKFAGTYIQAFPSIMKYKNKNWKKIYGFVYYRISMLLEACFSSVTRFNINPYKGKWHEGNQLIIPCLKNGGM